MTTQHNASWARIQRLNATVATQALEIADLKTELATVTTERDNALYERDLPVVCLDCGGTLRRVNL